jgi:hypothetical protein
MSRNHFATAGAIGTVSIGLLAASLGAGCGSSAPSASGSAKTPEKASIVQDRLVVGGCGATGTFTVTSPQVINFIAVNSNAFHDTQMQLQVTTDDNRTIQINKQSQHADSLLQSAIDNAVTSFNLNKTMFDQTTNQDTSQTTSASNDISESAMAEQKNSGFAHTLTDTSNVVFTKNEANQSSSSHQDSTVNDHAFNDTNASNSSRAGNHADAFQEANADNTARTRNTANNSANNMAFGTNIAQFTNNGLVPVATGGVGTFPLFNSTLSNTMFNNGASSLAMADNTSLAKNNAHNDAFTNVNNNTHSNNNSDVNNTANVDNSTEANTRNRNHVDDMSLAVNLTHLDTTTEFMNDSTVTSSRALDQDSTSMATTSADTEAHVANLAIARAENTSDFDSTNNSDSNSRASVFAKLSQFQSHQFQLTANLTNSQVNAVLQVFTGNQDDIVSNAAAFPIVTPTCN